MSKRQLDGDERAFTEKNLKNRKEEVEQMESNLAYNKALIAKQNYLRDFDDEFRGFLRDQKDNEDKRIIESVEKEIASIKELIEVTEKQLTEGVEEKVPTGVQ